MRPFLFAFVLTLLVASTVFSAVAAFGAVCYRHGVNDTKVALSEGRR